MGKLFTVWQNSSLFSNKLIASMKSLATIGIMRFYLQSDFQIIWCPSQISLSQVRIKAEQLVMVINLQKKKSPEKVICAVEQLIMIFEWTCLEKSYLCFLYQMKSGEKLYSTEFPLLFCLPELIYFTFLFVFFKRPHWLRHLKYKMVIKNVWGSSSWLRNSSQ